MNRSTTSMTPLKNYYDIDSRIQQLINTAPSECLMAHIVQQAAAVIPCYHASVDTTSGANFASMTSQANNQIPPLPTFVNFLARRSSARTSTLLASLVLLDRLRQRLSQFARGMSCTCQRIFLATLIVTTKLLHDTSPKNKHWMKYAVYFTLPEINLMESQLLALLDYRLTITEKDLYYSFLIYDNMLNSQLHQQHHYHRQQLNHTSFQRTSHNSGLSKSASCNVAYYSHSRNGGQNYTPTTHLLQHQQTQQLPILSHQHEYYRNFQSYQQQSYRQQQQQQSFPEMNYCQRYESSATRGISSSHSSYPQQNSIDVYYSTNYNNDGTNHHKNFFNNDSNQGIFGSESSSSKRSGYHHITASTSSSSLSSSFSTDSTVDELIFTPTTATVKSNSKGHITSNANPTQPHGYMHRRGSYTSNSSSRNLTTSSNGSGSNNGLYYHQPMITAGTLGNNYNNINTAATVLNSTAVGPPPASHDHSMLRSTSYMWFDSVLAYQPLSEHECSCSATLHR